MKTILSFEVGVIILFSAKIANVGGRFTLDGCCIGHCNIRTTQIYAKIVDEQKRKAVNLIPKL